MPAGFPNWTAGIEALRAFARHGADFLEVAVPHHTPAWDGPDTAAAHVQALDQGARMAHVVSTIRLTITATAAPVIAAAYWESVMDRGMNRFAQDLAQAGAAGARVIDLPPGEAAGWAASARAAGLHTAQIIAPGPDAVDLDPLNSTEPGWIHLSAGEAPTGTDGPADLAPLLELLDHIRAASPLPVAVDIGTFTPQSTVAVAPYTDAVVVGSPLIRPLLDPHGAGLDSALEQLRAFANALHSDAPRPPRGA
ncbi:tryptophan synthase subunit alpha [Streptomyces sp. NBC_01304]|uniref:tryptophan synthase subunit alpha n=1 Tax=Streptomyces sp. NBC_01304 TaxID=2903818 RepID=UPI002E15EF10|nr:tryptophan synthase subunit alpha [Streptomyces sp. NBC_01304]